MMLSEAAMSVWAKTGGYEDGEPTLWLPLVTHLADTAGVAELIFDQWLSESQWRVLTDCAPADVSPEDQLEAARAFTRLAAVLHDIGKSCVAFSHKAPALAAVMQSLGIEMTIDNYAEVKTLPHGLAGQVLVENWLMNRGWSKEQQDALASIVGGHHGIPPSRAELRLARIHPLLAGPSWYELQAELLSWAASAAELERCEEVLKRARWSQAALVLVEGVVITADWIASNSDYFPLVPLNSALPRQLLENPELQQQRVTSGWQKIQISLPWEPIGVGDDGDAALRSRFHLPTDAALRPVQRQAIRIAKRMSAPGMMIVEDVMGSGKTEAGLLAAEVLAKRSGAAGVMMVLPTQAMADAMFARFVPWMRRVISEPDAVSSINLIHSKAGMNPLFEQMESDLVAVHGLEIPETAGDVAIDESDTDKKGAVVVRHPWMNRKKALLSDFVVGTIDQLLLMALRSRHLALRHLGISRKVVVIDEIHAVDAFMGVYLERALEWLGAYGVSVIALSATLTPSLRKKLFEAYERGRSGEKTSVASPKGKRLSRRHLGDVRLSIPAAVPLEYPAISCLSKGEIETAAVATSAESKSIKLEFLSSSQLHRKVSELMSDDGCLLIIRNTVKQAQATYEALRGQYGDEVRLMHSRFISKHRVENDTWLRDNFGPPAADRTRPRRAIVVATQVAEQSLDIDFDCLITDLAPIDLIFQRAGRVHRHKREDRPKPMREPICFVLDVPAANDAKPEACASVARNIYSPLLQLRTADLLHRHVSKGLCIPDDMAEATYWVYDRCDGIRQNWVEAERGLCRDHKMKVESSQKSASSFRLRDPSSIEGGLIGWVDDAPSEIEANARAKVREGEDSLEVILVESVAQDRNRWAILSSFEGSEESHQVDRWNVPSKEVSRKLMHSMVRLPPSFTDSKRVERVIAELEGNTHAWNQSYLLAGQLVLVLSDGKANLVGKTLRYSREKGLEEV